MASSKTLQIFFAMGILLLRSVASLAPAARETYDAETLCGVTSPSFRQWMKNHGQYTDFVNLGFWAAVKNNSDGSETIRYCFTRAKASEDGPTKWHLDIFVIPCPSANYRELDNMTKSSWDIDAKLTEDEVKRLLEKKLEISVDKIVDYWL